MEVLSLNVLFSKYFIIYESRECGFVVIFKNIKRSDSCLLFSVSLSLVTSSSWLLCFPYFIRLGGFFFKKKKRKGNSNDILVDIDIFYIKKIDVVCSGVRDRRLK